MKYVKSLVKIGVLGILAQPLFSIAGGPDEPLNNPLKQPTYALRTSEIRASAGFGPRFVNDQVMRNSAWDTVLNLSLAALRNCKTHPCKYGLQMGANTAWSSRFNSVNNPASTAVAPVSVHNSASLDLLAVFSWDWSKLGIEVGVGPQLSWVKWLNSVQQATSRARVVPKLRVAITHKISQHTQVYIAASEAFNPYGKLRCSSGAFNCFDDAGYVSVTDLMIGISKYF